MTEYLMTDRFIISGIQLGMLHMLTGYDEQATEIVEMVLQEKVSE